MHIAFALFLRANDARAITRLGDSSPFDLSDRPLLEKVSLVQKKLEPR
jgi:hypothetical protein